MRAFIAILWLLGIAGLVVCVTMHVRTFVVAVPDDRMPIGLLGVGSLLLFVLTLVVIAVRWEGPLPFKNSWLQCAFALYLMYSLACFVAVPTDGHFEWKQNGTGAIVNGGRVVRTLSAEDAVRTRKAITRSQSANLLAFYSFVAIGSSIAFKNTRRRGNSPSASTTGANAAVS